MPLDDLQMNFNGRKPKQLTGLDFANSNGSTGSKNPFEMGAMGGPKPDYKPKQFHAAPPKLANEPVKAPPVNKLTVAYQNWAHSKHPEDMDKVLANAKDIMEKGITTYSGVDSPLMRARAKTLAIQAVKSYDPEAKANLGSWIMTNLQGLTRYRQQSSPIRIPERVQYELHHINQISTELYDELGRDPTIDELADKTGLSPKRINYVRKFNRRVRTESDFVDEEGGSYLPGVADTSAENVWAEYVYHDLDDVNKQIYDMRVRQGMSVNDIANKLKMSASAVSQRASKISDMLNEGLGMKEM